MKTPLQLLIEWTKAHYGTDELSSDAAAIISKANDLLDTEAEYIRRAQSDFYDHGYETGLRINVAKSYD